MGGTGLEPVTPSLSSRRIRPAVSRDVLSMRFRPVGRDAAGQIRPPECCDCCDTEKGLSAAATANSEEGDGNQRGCKTAHNLWIETLPYSSTSTTPRRSIIPHCLRTTTARKSPCDSTPTALGNRSLDLAHGQGLPFLG